ncbi:MAG: phosphoribosylanthranilate isomerase [Deltaproteobacteria bacterium HGW-Deltaproteobacteria-7]|jgi:phosphoribosylanthranilate isomerase|nr:MAG: phosphoribosylanthranilate isomerase [Deltaproteobacteria bacterium HGW-Deltaproteobacteria-7]PKN19477.1 MAG: phosphoribosylanthranilate isomerase [Deltaproteobacteria bacterium HGW-Deltaproteobacteria-6]
MIQVKICGITNLEDATCAAENGAAAVGFIFYPRSPRYIEPQMAGEIIDRLPGHLVKVGVFVNEKPEVVKKIFEDCCLDMIQLHGDESPEYCRQFPEGLVIKALELKTEEDLEKATDFAVAAILADSRHAGLYGGTGKTADWTLASQISKPLILSGGLNEGNIADALQKVHPAALDINSGVESATGKKDSAKIARIMQIIKDATTGDKIRKIFIRRERA